MTQLERQLRPAPIRPMLLLWRVATIILVLLVFAAAGMSAILLNFNPNRYAPALVMALERATGRQVTLNGPVSICWSLAIRSTANQT